MNFQEIGQPNCKIEKITIEAHRHRIEGAARVLANYNAEGLKPHDIVHNLLADLMWLCACADEIGAFGEHLATASSFFRDESEGRM